MHVLALVALGILAPACGNSTQVGGSMLLGDGFDAGFPNGNWTPAALTGSATVAFDSGTGFPAPSIKMTTTAATATAAITTVLAFSNPNVTISVAIADLSTSMTQVGTGTITIFDATPSSVATASWDNTTGMITFHINGATDVQSGVIAADGTFHRIVFSVSSGGMATWMLDGGSALLSQGLPAGPLKLQLGASFGAGTAWPSFFFDNVTVTSP